MSVWAYTRVRLCDVCEGVCVNILCVCSLTASMCVYVRLDVRPSAKLSHVCLGASVCACVCVCRDIAILVCQALLWAVMTSLLVTCRNERRTADITPLSPFLTLFLLPYIYIFRHADNTSDLFVLSHRLKREKRDILSFCTLCSSFRPLKGRFTLKPKSFTHLVDFVLRNNHTTLHYLLTIMLFQTHSRKNGFLLWNPKS